MRLSFALALVACSAGGKPGQQTAPPDAPVDAAPAGVTVTDGANDVTIVNGNVKIVYDKMTGLSSVSCSGVPAIQGAYASADLGSAGGGVVSSKDYTTHAFKSGDVSPVHDGFGDGVKVPIVSVKDGLPAIRQTFTLYPSHPEYFLLDESVESTAIISSNNLGALIVDNASGWVAAPPGSDPRFLDAPFDNDEWVRWDSRRLGAYDFTGTSYEVSALYDSGTRNGLVIGSVTHDFWKTGIKYDFDSANHHLRGLSVFGGVATQDISPQPSGATYGGDGTHDLAAHGKQTGMTLTSPRIFVGCFADWRDGLEAYGQANATITPPRTWTGGAPFGWMSWGAYGNTLTASQVMAASDFLKSMPSFTSPGGVYVDIDAGFHADTSCADQTCVAAHIHANGQRAGTYRTPFSYFGTDLTAAVGGTTYKYSDIVLRDDSGNPIRRHNSYILDVTHPGTKKLINDAMISVVNQGFDLVKLDFLTDGAMEGHHYDPTISTGIQAYNQAMAYIDSLLPSTVFISESIAPLFPSQYAHARRLSTDVVGQINDSMCPTWPHYGSTEYMLNSLTFEWWMQGTLYAFNDPDAMALLAFKPSGTAQYPEAWAKARATASAIAGTVFFDTTDYSDPTGAARARTYLNNPAIDGIAAAGRSFRPVDGAVGWVNASSCYQTDHNSGAAAAQLFERHEPDGSTLVAVFDYGSGGTVSIDLTRLGLPMAQTYRVEEIWSATKSTTPETMLTVTLQPGEAQLLRIAPPM
jgi:hypothetical protein